MKSTLDRPLSVPSVPLVSKGRPSVFPAESMPRIASRTPKVRSEMPATRPPKRLRREALAPASAECNPERLVFGPRSTPLFFTGLLKAPALLTMRGLEAAEPLRLLFGALGEKAQELTSIKLLEGMSDRRAWSLEGQVLRPNTLYTWQALTSEESGTGENADSPEALRGWFWLLDSERREVLKYGLEQLNKTPDPFFQAQGRAMLLAKLGLYQDALRMTRCDSQVANVPAFALLAHTVQVQVYRAMSQHLEKYDASTIHPPFCFHTWAIHREQHHRAYVRDCMENGPNR